MCESRQPVEDDGFLREGGRLRQGNPGPDVQQGGLRPSYMPELRPLLSWPAMWAVRHCIGGHARVSGTQTGRVPPCGSLQHFSLPPHCEHCLVHQPATGTVIDSR